MAKRIITRGGTGEITEKKSRFIASVFSVKTEEEAIDKIAELKKKYWDARHNCWAYIISGDESHGEILRCSDDGEPAQTAGRPMLDVLCSAELTDVLVVVTRYFGGVLLGTGGLVRAYQAAAKAGLEASGMAEVLYGVRADITTDYTGLGKIQYVLAEQDIAVIDTRYEADVTIEAMVPSELKGQTEKAILEKTAGQARIEYSDETAYISTADGIKEIE